MRLLTLFVALAFAIPLSAGWQRERVINPDGSLGPWSEWRLVGPSPAPEAPRYFPAYPLPAPVVVVHPQAQPIPTYYYSDPSCQTGA